MTYGKTAKLRKVGFSRPGYVFLGWSKKGNGSLAYKNGQAVKNLTANGGIFTLHAKWAKKNFKVAFYPNGGTGKMAVQTFNYGKAKKLLANKFKRGKWRFEGWAKSKNGNVVYPNKAAVKNLVQNGKTVKLYAVWSLKVNVTLDPNGGTVPKNKLTVKLLEAINGSYYLDKTWVGKTGYQPTRNGYYTGSYTSWAIWYTKKTGGTSFDNLYYKPSSIPTSLTLYARWEPREYALRFTYCWDNDGLVCEWRDFKYGKSLGPLPVPTRPIMISLVGIRSLMVKDFE